MNFDGNSNDVPLEAGGQSQTPHVGRAVKKEPSELATAHTESLGTLSNDGGLAGCNTNPPGMEISRLYSS
jgi:hypothetical protein